MTEAQQRKNNVRRIRRAKRVRGKISGTAQRPRLSVYRSNQHIYVQAIDDVAAVTVVGKRDDDSMKGTKTERAQIVAKAVAADLKKAGVSTVVFDRGSYRYHGRVKAIAETLRAEGIQL